jgi:hypothetical protein
MDWMTRNVDMDGTARAVGEINGIGDALERSEAETRARMPERIFVALWMAVFVEGKNPFYPTLDFNVWANFAGNEYREVDVYDPKTGETLFSVPPLFDRTGIKSITGDDRKRIQGGNILNVIRNAELKSRVSPKDGKAFLEAHLKQRAMFMGQLPPSVKENILRWNAIFKRYGAKPIVETEELTQGADALSKTSDNQLKVTSDDDWEPL